MAMSKLNIPIYPWLQGHNSPQLDYIEDLTEHDDEFMYVNCMYYCDDFTYSIRGLKSGENATLFDLNIEFFFWKNRLFNDHSILFTFSAGIIKNNHSILLLKIVGTE